MADFPTGVGVEFFCASLKQLERRFGKRMGGPTEPMNELIQALGAAERAYQKLDPVPAKRGKKGEPGAGGGEG